MEVLCLTREILVIIGLCELTGNEWIIRTRLRQRLSFSIILTVMIAMEASSILYVWNHLRIGDLESSLYAAFQVAAAFCIIGSLITISYQKKKVQTILDGFQAVVDNCKYTIEFFLNPFILSWFDFEGVNSPSKEFFVRANEFPEYFIKWCSIAMIGCYWAMSIAFAGSIAAFYYFQYGYVDAAQLYLPMKFTWVRRHIWHVVWCILFVYCIYVIAITFDFPFRSTPFDENTISGWFYVLVAGLITASVYAFCNVSIVAFFMSMGMYFAACRFHFQTIFTEMNDMVNLNDIRNMHTMESQLKRMLHIAVNYHNSIIEWEKSVDRCI